MFEPFDLTDASSREADPAITTTRRRRGTGRVGVVIFLLLMFAASCGTCLGLLR